MKQSLAGLGLVLLAAGAPVQSPTAKLDPRMARGFEAIREQDLRGDLTFLASDPLQGRMSLQPGSEVAIEWIAGEFHKAGLAPAASGSYFQTVPLVEYRPDLEAMRLTLTRGGRPQTFAYLKDFYGGFAREVTLSAPLVFAGYGITAPEFGSDDYANVDAGGKIVLLFDHEPQEDDARSPFNGLGNTRHANSRLKILNAQRHGALAVLVAPEPNRKHPSNIDRLKRIPGFTERIRRFPSQAIADDEVRIPLLSLDDLSVKTLLATQPRSPSELQTAIDASLKPGSLALPDTTVEIRIANGSGTVGVVALAHAFAANRERPRRTLLFAVFAAEERGLLGSYYYNLHPLRPLETTRAVINFDMIGRNESPSAQTEGLIEIAADTSNELNLIGTINSPQYRAVTERANESVGLGLNYKWDDDAALNIFQRSDQFPFALHDIPAVWWFTGFHPDYHQPSDTVEKINFGKMAKIVRLPGGLGVRG